MGEPVTYRPGDRVIVDFDGIDMPGEVISQGPSSGYVMAVVVNPDPEIDLGRITPAFDPQPTVCVPACKVRRV